MNTKEAIKFMEKGKEFRIRFYDDNYFPNTNEIIRLLKRGEKYGAMWERLFNTYPCCSIDDGLSIQLMLGSAMGKLEEEYFPKGGNDGTRSV